MSEKGSHRNFTPPANSRAVTQSLPTPVWNAVHFGSSSERFADIGADLTDLLLMASLLGEI